LTQISDANVVVAFKNLTKKDSTTKAKALEDLQSILASSSGDPDEAVIEAWVRVFPRLSVETSRRVRQLAHTFNGQLSSRCGKRIARQLPKIAGPWLAGCYDGDKAVARAAQDALKTVFPTPEKIQGVRKTFHEPILSYCKENLINETEDTLSDKRSVPKEDAEATFARVMSTSAAVVVSLLETMDSDELSKQDYLYEAIASDGQVLGFTSHSDAGLRKATFKLYQTYLVKSASVIEANQVAISAAFIYKALIADQTGSSTNFIQTLDLLTEKFPSLWTTSYHGKKPAISRLKQSLKHGSYSGSSAYWDSMSRLFRRIPSEVFPTTYDEISELLRATREGIGRREERLNTTAAWPAFFTLTNELVSNLSSEEGDKALDEFTLPIVNQYLFPAEETAQWAVAGAKPAVTIAQIALIQHAPLLLERRWPELAAKLIDLAKLSQPEQSKDFEKSQKQVATAGERWAALQRELFGLQQTPESLLRALKASGLSVFNNCISLVVSRSGKPFGATAIIAELLRSCAQQFISDEEFRTVIIKFVAEDAPKLFFSPSQVHLTVCVYALAQDSQFETIFQAIIQHISSFSGTTEEKLVALHSLFSRKVPPNVPRLAQESIVLQDLIKNLDLQSLDLGSITILSHLLKQGIFSDATAVDILTKLTQELTLNGPSLEQSLHSWEVVVKENKQAVQSFITKVPAGSEVLPNVLRLEQSEDDAVAAKAAALSSVLTSTMGEGATSAKFGVVLQNLEKEPLSGSLSIDAVISLALATLDENKEAIQVHEILPSVETWESSIDAVARVTASSLSLLSDLGGAVHLLSSIDQTSQGKTVYDSEGLSQALRIGMYAAQVLARGDLQQSSTEELSDALALLSITALLAEDQSSINGINDIWNSHSPTVIEAEVLDFVKQANECIKKHVIPAATNSNHADVTGLDSLTTSLAGITERHPSNSPMTYYASLASAKYRDSVFEEHGYSSQQSKACEEILMIARQFADTIGVSSCLVGFAQPLAGNQAVMRLCNELVASLTILDASSDSQKGLESLILLANILRTQEDIATTIAKSRLIFFVKHLIQWLENDQATETVRSETYKVLNHLLPQMEDIYGEHWGQLLGVLLKSWTTIVQEAGDGAISEYQILDAHGSLRLYATLKRIASSEEANDDIVDAIKEHDSQLHDALLGLLRPMSRAADEQHQGQMVTNELLGRQISKLTFKPIADIDDFYSMMYSDSRSIQTATFDLLHNQIPKMQEQVSLDAALEDKAAKVPDELLSLLLEAPSSRILQETPFVRVMPLALQGYLASWRLLFDHFDGSSYRVKSDYVDQLKEGDYLTGLLGLIFGFLGHTSGRPINASSLDIQDYVPDTEPTPEKDAQWLLAHLYYLALLHLPSLVKTYVLDVRSRQTSQAIDSWTAKYVSPVIVSASLQAVADWAGKSVKDDPDYENMTVKVGMKSKEINASYLVDEQIMAIKIVLPETYPLTPAQVLSVNRVAVKEEKWQSWLRNCSGVITFSNGSITDGLTAWRKNVTGALKGQTECAICYSIISGDKQLPTKRCPTCRNLFHSSCLFKWFKTSNASTCPLCRNPFNFN